jgi:hypothetical protein
VKKTIISIFLWGTFGGISCEKKIDFPLKESEPLLCVDASIETGKFPNVVLTKSINFFSSVTPEILSTSMIPDAVVEISNGIKNVPLIKNEITFPGNLKYIFYTCDPADESLQLKGEEGEKYSLKIQWQNKIYTSETTIPLLRKSLDSLWWVKAPETPETSTKIILKGIFTDPPLFGDYVRYFTKVNSEPFFPGINSAFDDLFVNGTRYEIDIPKGVDRNTDEDLLNEQFFRRGDTITVKLSGIDKATYDFWRTAEFSYQSAGNPFSTPVKILGNISNGALGYFGGYANQFKTIIIPAL